MVLKYGRRLMLGLALASCATSGHDPRVFKEPALYVDQTVKLCGVMVGGPEFIPSKGSPDRLSIVELGPLDHTYRGPVCVTGTIVYLGCESGDVICSGWVRDYGILVNEIAGEE